MALKIVLATGIYPPDLGGPATYVHALAKELHERGHAVTVVTYGMEGSRAKDQGSNAIVVVVVSRSGGPLLRWLRYARALRRHAADADVIEAFSSISAGVPLLFARLSKPKRVLRLGGDFFWERYTDHGGMLGLRDWTALAPLHRRIMGAILRRFDHIVFSTAFQETLYRRHYPDLPPTSVVENAMPAHHAPRRAHRSHTPFRLLFVGRFVRFKNLEHLLFAMTHLPQATLTCVGDGPLRLRLCALAGQLGLENRVRILAPARGGEKEKLLAENIIIIVGEITDIDDIGEDK